MEANKYLSLVNQILNEVKKYAHTAHAVPTWAIIRNIKDEFKLEANPEELEEIINDCLQGRFQNPETPNVDKVDFNFNNIAK